MKLFDLHCDTISRCREKSLPLRNNQELSISLEKAQGYQNWAQVFAICVPEAYKKNNPYSQFIAQRDFFALQIEKNADCAVFVRSKEDFLEAEQTGKCAAFLGIEGALVLEGRPERIGEVKQMGVRVITLTWNFRNEIACGIGEERDTGMTKIGVQCVQEMAKQGIVIDVSHLSVRSFDDLLQATDVPFIASHSNLKRLCGHRRNLSDEQFREIVRRKGLVGVNFYPEFLENDSSKASIDSIIKHIETMLELGGEEVVAIGSDFDGASMPSDLQHIGDVEKLYERLLQRGYSEELVQNLFYNNARRVFWSALEK